MSEEQGRDAEGNQACTLTDEQIWDDLGILADGIWTIGDLWDHARLLGVKPSSLLPDCYRPQVTVEAA